MKSQASMLCAVAFAGVMLPAGAAAAADSSLAQSADRLIVTAMGSAAVAVPMTEAEMGSARGGGFLSSLLAVLPPQNTVQSQIGDSAPVVNSGAGPQTLTLSTPTTNVNLSASNPGLPPPPPVTRTQSIVITQSFTRSFSLRF